MNRNIEYGSYLSEARERKGVTIKTVSQDTKLSMDTVIALEKMDKSIFPSETYLIGMLRLYAKYLSLDPETVIEMLKINEIQEKPVDFELINLQETKRKIRKRNIIIALIFLLVGGIVALLYFDVPRMTYDMVAEFNASQKNKELNINRLDKINGFYEAYFDLGTSVLLISNEMQEVLQVVSIQPPQVELNGNRIALEIQQPYLLDLDNNGTPEYVLLMRTINTARNQLQLRFDPQIEQTYSTETKETDELEEYIADGEIIEIQRSEIVIPIQLKLAFKHEMYYRIQTVESTIVEANANTGEEKFYTSEEPIFVYLSTGEFVDMSVNGQQVSLSEGGLPIVYRIAWSQDNDAYVLQAIPLP